MALAEVRDYRVDGPDDRPRGDDAAQQRDAHAGGRSETGRDDSAGSALEPSRCPHSPGCAADTRRHRTPWEARSSLHCESADRTPNRFHSVRGRRSIHRSRFRGYSIRLVFSAANQNGWSCEGGDVEVLAHGKCSKIAVVLIHGDGCNLEGSPRPATEGPNARDYSKTQSWATSWPRPSLVGRRDNSGKRERRSAPRSAANRSPCARRVPATGPRRYCARMRCRDDQAGAVFPPSVKSSRRRLSGSGCSRCLPWREGRRLRPDFHAAKRAGHRGPSIPRAAGPSRSYPASTTAKGTKQMRKARVLKPVVTATPHCRQPSLRRPACRHRRLE